MLGVGGYAPSVSSFTSNSPLGYQGVYSAEQNAQAEGSVENLAFKAGFKNADQVVQAALNGTIDPYTAQYYLTAGITSTEFKASPEQEKLLNNLIAKYQSRNALIWQGEQLQALGLANSGVLQTGAAHTAQDMSNLANSRANRMAGIANSLISMAGRMASSGIYGSALSAVKTTAAEAAGFTASSMKKSFHYSGWIKADDEFWKNR